jgi:hypothetical protein
MPTDLNLKLDPIERVIFDGLVSRLQTVTDAPFVWTASLDTIQVVKRMFGNNRIKYPFGSLLLKQWTESTERGSTNAASRRGRISVITTDQKRFYRVHYLPVDFDVECKIVTNDYAEVLRLANSLMFSRRNGWLKFAAAYGGNSFDISVLPDSSVAFPESSGDQDSAKEYELMTSIVVGGYISYPELLEGQVVDTIHEVYQLPAVNGGDNEEILRRTPPPDFVNAIRYVDSTTNIR